MKPLNDLIKLKNKTAIVTGGAVGIGQGIVRRLAEAGAQVLVADASDANLEVGERELAEYKQRITMRKTDVANDEQVGDLVSSAKELFGHLDILVNNAGIYPNHPMLDMPTDLFDRVLAVNLKGVFLTTRAVAQCMVEQGKGGRIINVTSIDALHPSMVGLAHYDASKHGVWGFTKNVALELAPHQIWVNAVAPGGIKTPGATPSGPAADDPKLKAFQEAFTAKIPMQRLGEPDDIAKTVLFLASDMSSYITGSQIVVDGGRLLN